MSAERQKSGWLARRVAWRRPALVCRGSYNSRWLAACGGGGLAARVVRVLRRGRVERRDEPWRHLWRLLAGRAVQDVARVARVGGPVGVQRKSRKGTSTRCVSAVVGGEGMSRCPIRRGGAAPHANSDGDHRGRWSVLSSVSVPLDCARLWEASVCPIDTCVGLVSCFVC